MPTQLQSAFVLVLFVFIYGETLHAAPNYSISSPSHKVINLYTILADKFFDSLQPYLARGIIQNGMDPMELADFSDRVLPLPGKLKGRIDLKNGWLQELSKVQRAKHVTVSYSNKRLVLDMDLGWKMLDFNYEYLFQYLLVRRRGDVNGRFHNVELNVIVTIDLYNYTVNLDDIRFMKVGNFNFKLEGHFVDPILNIVSKMITTICRNHVLRSVETRGLIIFRKMIDELNAKIPRPPHKELIDMTVDELLACLNREITIVENNPSSTVLRQTEENKN